jgi:hypothetical protein
LSGLRNICYGPTCGGPPRIVSGRGAAGLQGHGVGRRPSLVAGGRLGARCRPGIRPNGMSRPLEAAPSGSTSLAAPHPHGAARAAARQKPRSPREGVERGSDVGPIRSPTRMRCETRAAERDSVPVAEPLPHGALCQTVSRGTRLGHRFYSSGAGFFRGQDFVPRVRPRAKFERRWLRAGRCGACGKPRAKRTKRSPRGSKRFCPAHLRQNREYQAAYQRTLRRRR